MTLVKIGVSTNRMTDYTPMAYGLNCRRTSTRDDGLTSEYLDQDIRAPRIIVVSLSRQPLIYHAAAIR
jgi:hypothetical protein